MGDFAYAKDCRSNFALIIIPLCVFFTVMGVSYVYFFSWKREVESFVFCFLSSIFPLPTTKANYNKMFGIISFTIFRSFFAAVLIDAMFWAVSGLHSSTLTKLLC